MSILATVGAIAAITGGVCTLSEEYNNRKKAKSKDESFEAMHPTMQADTTMNEEVNEEEEN